MAGLVRTLLFLLVLSTAVATADPVLRVALAESDYPPFYYIDPDTGQLAGVSVDVCRSVAAILGYQLDFVRYPFVRVLHTLGTGQVDMACTLFNTRARAPGAIYVSVPHVFENIYLITRTGKTFDSPINSTTAQNFSVGSVRGYYYGPQMEDSFTFRKQVFNNDEQLVKALMFGRIDIALSNRRTFDWYAKSLGIGPEAWHTEGEPIYSGPIYIAFSRQRADAHQLASEFTRALVAFRQTTEFQQILARYAVNHPRY